MAIRNYSATSERLRSALPVWKILLILLTFLIVGAGTFLWWTGSAEPQATTITTATTSKPSIAVPGFADSTLSAPAEVTTTTVTQPSWKQTAGKWGAKLGGSFLVALILGVMFRVFIRVAVGFAAILVVILVLLGYSGMFSADKADAAKQRVGQAVSRIEDESSKFKDIAMTSLPSAGAALVGFFVGFARR